MRIDSGLSGYYYQGRLQYDQTEAEDTAAETATKSRPRTTGNAVVSSTLLSSSLASALWVIEGGKSDEVAPAQATDTVSVEEFEAPSSAEQIEALYREFGGSDA